MPRAVTLAQMRQQKQMTFSRLSEESGVAVTTIIAIERGSKPRLSTIKKLCETLKCSQEDIAWPGDVTNTQRQEQQDVHAPFRYCLEFLKNASTFERACELDNGIERVRPEKYLVGTDVETSWLQAPATLEMYWTDQVPQENQIAGNLEVEFQTALRDGPFGKEVVYRKERWVVRFVKGMIHREARELEDQIKAVLPALPSAVNWSVQGLSDVPFTDAGRGRDLTRFTVRLLGPNGLPKDIYCRAHWEAHKAEIENGG